MCSFSVCVFALNTECCLKALQLSVHADVSGFVRPMSMLNNVLVGLDHPQWVQHKGHCGQELGLFLHGQGFV